MEAIFLLAMVFVEIIVGVAVPLVMLAVELIATVVAFIVELLVMSLFGAGAAAARTADAASKRKASSDEPPLPDAVPEPTTAADVTVAKPYTGIRLWTRRIAFACLAASVLSLIGILAANFLFFESVVRLATNRVANRSGITIDFKGAKGSLFTGSIRFEGLRVTRDGHPNSNYDIQLDKCDLKISVMTVLKKERRVQNINASGVRGTFERLAPSDATARKPFIVEHLSISNAALDVTDNTPPGGIARLKLELDSFIVDNYESQWPVLDILFTSNTRGRVEGDPFEITSSTDADVQTSQWKAGRLPLPLVVTYLGGPFRLLREGNAEILVDNSWKKGEENPKIDMHWRITFTDLKAGIPVDANEIYAKFLDPVVGHIELQNGKLPLDFHVVIDQQAFRGKASLESIGLWTVIRESAIRTFEDNVGVKFDVVVERVIDAAGAVREAAKGAADRMKNARKNGKGLRERMKSAFGRNKDKSDEPAESDAEKVPPLPAK